MHNVDDRTDPTRTEALRDALNELIHLDHDAIEAYTSAIVRLDSRDAKAQLQQFCNDHRKHVETLTKHVRDLGGTPVEGPDLKRVLTQGKVVVRSVTGDLGILKAMQSNEEDTNEAYSKALERDDLTDDVRTTLQQHRAEEWAHLLWITTEVERRTRQAEAEAESTAPTDTPRYGNAGEVTQFPVEAHRSDRQAVAALFATRHQAEQAVADLCRTEVPRHEISVLSHHDLQDQVDGELSSESIEDPGLAEGTGAAVGGAVGGILTALGLAAIPGVGWILAAGPIASVLATGAVGAAVGAAGAGLTAAMSSSGIDSADAEIYAEAVRRGGTLVVVTGAEAQTSGVLRTLRGHGPVDLDEAVERWKAEGWAPSSDGE